MERTSQSLGSFEATKKIIELIIGLLKKKEDKENIGHWLVARTNSE